MLRVHAARRAIAPWRLIFRAAEEEQAARAQGEMENVEDLLLRLLFR